MLTLLGYICNVHIYINLIIWYIYMMYYTYTHIYIHIFSPNPVQVPISFGFFGSLRATFFFGQQLIMWEDKPQHFINMAMENRSHILYWYCWWKKSQTTTWDGVLIPCKKWGSTTNLNWWVLPRFLVAINSGSSGQAQFGLVHFSPEILHAPLAMGTWALTWG